MALPVSDAPLLLDPLTRIGAKLLLNALSTCVMVRLGRVLGNRMIWVVPSNLKLIDRSVRYIPTWRTCPTSRPAARCSRSSPTSSRGGVPAASTRRRWASRRCGCATGASKTPRRACSRNWGERARVDYRARGVFTVPPALPPHRPAPITAALRCAATLIVAAAVATFVPPVVRADGARPTLPRSTPERQGVASAAILDFVQSVDRDIDAMHSMMIVRHGHVIAEGWWAASTRPAAHNVLAHEELRVHGRGLAVSEGLLSVDDHVLRFFPAEAPAEPGAFLRALRVRDLL